ncbi:MAG: hypothetical protein WA151_10295, partial [Desulfatirhabdiaceae bacterium]
FFGGSRGGAKSDCLIGRQLRGSERWDKRWNGLVLRKKYKDLSEMRRRFDELITDGMPATRIGGDQQTNYVRFKNGASVTLAAIQKLEQVNDFIGAQFTEIAFDEAPMFPWFLKLVDKLKGSNRSPHGVPCRMFGTGNPGGPGHLQVKEYFGLGTGGVPPETIIRILLSGGHQETRIFIPSFLDDNKILCLNDPLYVARLKSIADPALRRAWIDGDWDVFIGQAFQFSERYHVIDPQEIPSGAPLYMTFDWGYGKPFSVGWWWVDLEGRVYRFSEWYGASGIDEGMRINDPDIALGIKEREQKLSINDRPIIRLAGPDCWNKKPDYKGGGQGPSTAETFAQHKIFLTPGDASRNLKIRQFRSRLSYKLTDEGCLEQWPMMMIYRGCKDFIRTIPALVMDEDNPEDIDTDMEDHVYDEACHICMARPITQLAPPKPKPTWRDRLKQRVSANASHMVQ